MNLRTLKIIAGTNDDYIRKLEMRLTEECTYILGEKDINKRMEHYGEVAFIVESLNKTYKENEKLKETIYEKIEEEKINEGKE